MTAAIETEIDTPPVARTAICRARRIAVFAGAFAAVAVALRLIHGPGTVGYDAAYAIHWGQQLLRGQSPSFEALYAPTPHPLTIAEGAVASLFGESAYAATSWFSLLIFAALIVVAFLFGRTLFTAAVGAALAVLVAFTPVFVAATQQAVLDPQFLLLMLAAGIFAYGGSAGERPRLAAATIGLAGLLRPEAWAVGVLYISWIAWRRGTGRGFVQVVALVLAAPVIWMFGDLLATGDALHSLHGTQELAEDLGRYRGGATAVRAGPAYLREILGWELLAIAIGGIVVGLRWLREPTLWLSTLLASGLGAFIALGLTGLPLIMRYLSIPAAALTAFASVMLAGWINLPAASRERRLLIGLAVASVVLLAIGAPKRADQFELARERARYVAAIQPAVERAAEAIESSGACAPYSLYAFSIAPQLARELEIGADRLELYRGSDAERLPTVVLINTPQRDDTALIERGYVRVGDPTSRVAVWTTCPARTG